MIKKNVPFNHVETICDNNGRYVIVVGTLCQYPVVLVNVYAPNHDDEVFMKNLLSSIPKLHSHYFVLEGDLNTVMNPLDKSNPKSITLSKMAQTLSQFIDQHGYIDPWRSLHPTDKQFSFFSTCS